MVNPIHKEHLPDKLFKICEKSMEKLPEFVEKFLD